MITISLNDKYCIPWKNADTMSKKDYNYVTLCTCIHIYNRQRLEGNTKKQSGCFSSVLLYYVNCSRIFNTLLGRERMKGGI